jgi:polysaccharide biosynthesis/export protein
MKSPAQSHNPARPTYFSLTPVNTLRLTNPLRVHRFRDLSLKLWALWMPLLALVATLALPGAARAADTAREYLLGAGDVVRVVVYQSPDLSIETRVSESGSITYPLLGSVKVGGLSVSQAEAAITRGLRDGDFLKRPQVLVTLVQVRANQVSVLGLVNRPGRYPLELPGMVLSELLAQAGGIAPGGADTVTLTGARDGKPYRVEIDLPALYAREQRGEDPVLRNGDVVFIDRAPTIYIYGEVQRPGPMRLERDMSVMQALAAGGGLTQRGTQKGLQVHRRGSDGRVQALDVQLNDRLQQGDVIQVRESLF